MDSKRLNAWITIHRMSWAALNCWR